MRTPEATPSRTISCHALTPLAASALRLRSASGAEASAELSAQFSVDLISDKACSRASSRQSFGLPLSPYSKLPLSLAIRSFRPTTGEAAEDAEREIDRETVAVFMYVCLCVFVYV